jgi:hypothetical protein
MKKFKITVTAELELPDDFELSEDPDGYSCLKKGGNCYHPELLWMCRQLYLEAGLLKAYESAPSVGWEPVDDETAEQLFGASITKDDVGTEVYQIEQL